MTGWVRYLVLLVPHFGLLATWDLAARLPVTLFWFGLALAALFWARRSSSAVSLRVFLIVAAALRLLMLPLPPTLSDDVYRYVWDGRVAGAGFNPYELAPDAPELESLRDGLWQTLPHRDVATVYPPLAITLFSIAARFAWPVLAWKLMLVIADLAACALLFRLAGGGQGNPARAAWYAWNPLATLEIAGMGHVDGLGVLAVVLTVWALVKGRKTAWAAFGASAGVLVKLVPLLAFPLWLRHARRRVLFVGLSLLVLATAFGPVLWGGGGVPSGYLAFGGSWEFNGPLYEPLWRLLEAADSRAGGEALLDGLKGASGRHDFWNRFYSSNHPRMHARVLLAALFGALYFRAWRRPDPVSATGTVFEILVLCSATVYPWYLLWLLPFAALEERPAWLALCSMTVVSYVPQFTNVSLMPWVFLVCWGPYAVVRAMETRWSAA